ncbi:hypothetical protein [Argonema galeatum]|uniref:hypothetical protein n=1 Tax=Argonema galeatum TaxID=2942762 RepID=UPI00201336E0|nr:hypothetical protein [Argonema galeatum]MCL1462926.1 hypothetical protein [Argonema galeatum A003/A1]
MQAYKAKAKIDQSGHLIITEPIDLPTGDVEVIILQEIENDAYSVNQKQEPPETKTKTIPALYSTNIFSDWLAKAKPVSSDFDAEQVRLEALEEKHR